MSSAHLKISEVRLKTLAVAVGACLVAGLALAQPPQRSGTPIQWLKGPVRINVGGGGGVTVAEVNIPPGYGFVGDAGARAVLTAMNNVPPNDLIGLIAPPEEKWVAIVQYAEVGYISNAGQDSLDARAVLEQIRAKIARQMK